MRASLQGRGTSMMDNLDTSSNPLKVIHKKSPEVE